MRILRLKKRPSERFPIGLKYVTPDLKSDEVITSAIVTVEPDIATGLTAVGSPIIDIDTVSQLIDSGEDGIDYLVKFKTTTSAGHTYQDSILVCVREE
jgi:hypothetical protein